MVTYRSILTAAGMLEDVDLIKTSWGSLTEARAAQDQYPDATDVHILTKACLLAGRPGFVTAVLSEMDNLTEEEKGRVHERLNEGLPEPSIDTPPPSFTTDFLEQVRSLKQDIDQFEALAQDYPTIFDLSSRFASLPMYLGPLPTVVQLPEQEMRQLYDEMTTDPTSPALPLEEFTSLNFLSIKPHLSKTKIPYGTLRYENWKTVNYLLALAERNDRLYEEAIDKAIAAGTPPPGRLEMGNVLKDGAKMKVGLSELAEGGVGELSLGLSEEEVQKRRAKIVALRTPTSMQG